MKINSDSFIALNKRWQDFFHPDEPYNKEGLQNDPDHLIQDILEIFKDKTLKFLFITRPFMEAVRKAKDKLVHLIEELKPCCYCVQDIGTLTCAFVKKTNYGTLELIHFEPSTGEIYGGSFWMDKKTAAEMSDGDYQEDYGVKFIKNEEGEDRLSFGTQEPFFYECFLAVMFLQFAEVETLILHQKNKRGKLAGCKYLNESRQDVTIVDSKWFTTLVQSEGFKVRGHFGFRAVGPNHTKRRLVWIKEYEKSGYTREAGILRH